MHLVAMWERVRFIFLHRSADLVHLLLFVSCFVMIYVEDLNISAGNILILRGDIEILPEDRTSVSYEQLAQLLAEYLLTHKTDVDIDSALATMPVTRSALSYLLRSTTDLSLDFALFQRAWTLIHYSQVSIYSGQQQTAENSNCLSTLVSN